MELRRGLDTNNKTYIGSKDGGCVIKTGVTNDRFDKKI